MPDDLEGLRQRLLEAALTHAAFDGWSPLLLRRAAADIDVSEAEAENAFPHGARDLLEYFSSETDREMLDALEQTDLESLKVRERVSLAVQTRLDLLLPHREAVRRGLSFLAMPQNAGLGTRLLWRTADAIWWAAGDSATDHNYYSKRALLVGVYSSTLLVWLDDQSGAQSDSKAFLERRIDGALKVGGRLGASLTQLLDLPDRLCGGLGRRRPLRRRSA